MKKEYDLDKWEEVENVIIEIKNEYPKTSSDCWFRGQSNSEWALETTLERRTKSDFSVYEYYKIIRRIKPEIEIVTGLTWQIPNMNEIGNWAKSYGSFDDILAYDYLGHLRHNGFPSPLLDWTFSPYVAAYFAFSGADKCGSERVAIFVFFRDAK